MKVGLLSLSIQMLLAATISANAQLKSATGFIGECVRKIGNVEDNNYCDENIMNINFQDGYISFQFNSKEKLKNGRYKESISFVGPNLAKQNGSGKDIIYLPVEQLTFAEGNKTKLTTRKVEDSVCLLDFINSDPKPENLRFIQCHYKEHGNIILYRGTNIRMMQFNNKQSNNSKSITAIDAPCNHLASLSKSDEGKKEFRSILDATNVDKKIDLGRSYMVGAITCECKMRNAKSIVVAINNFLAVDKIEQKYNVPMNDKPQNKSFLSFLGENHHSKEWTDKFNKWVIGEGEMPGADEQGLAACALVKK